jgi:hypothetical protein
MRRQMGGLRGGRTIRECARRIQAFFILNVSGKKSPPGLLSAAMVAARKRRDTQTKVTAPPACPASLPVSNVTGRPNKGLIYFCFWYNLVSLLFPLLGLKAEEDSNEVLQFSIPTAGKRMNSRK